MRAKLKVLAVATEVAASTLKMQGMPLGDCR